MAGLEKPTSGAHLLRRPRRHRPHPAAAQRQPGAPVLHQLPQPQRLREHRLAAPRRRPRPAPRSSAASRETAELLHLTPMLARRPQELSGGQQQRTALARAIVKSSDLVLLDEPLANLDYKLREEMRDQLPALFAGRGAIVVYATSEPTEALMLGGHTATIAEGRVTQFGPTLECYRAPVDLTTARVFSDPPINAAPVEKRGGEIVLLDRVRWPATGAAAGIPDGAYTLGAAPALRHAPPRRPGPGPAPRRGADHRALRLRERRPLRRRRHDLGRPVERRPPLPRRRHPRVLPRRRATASTSPPTAGGSPDGAHRPRGTSATATPPTRAGRTTTR